MKNQPAIFFRLLLIFAAVISWALIISLRLIDIQLVRGDEFLDRAEANRFFTHVLPRQRGVILDRYDQPLVKNIPVYLWHSEPEKLYSSTQVLTYDQALQAMATASAQVSYQLKREYKVASSAAHVLGYTGLVTAEDITSDKNLHPIDQVGKLGLEKTYDSVLRGELGTQKYEINALGERQQLILDQASQPGQDLPTTLDPYLSNQASSLLAGKKGTVVIQDAQTGEVLSLVSSPTFNPNIFTAQTYSNAEKYAQQQTIQAYFSSDDNVFFNRAISGAYPPGSVFKLITALAGLETQALDQYKTVEDKGVLEVGEYSYANWYYTQYGRVEGEVNLSKAIARSNDIYFYKAAEWIGVNKLAEMAEIFGLQQTTGIEISGEVSGLVPNPAWKEERLGERWFLGNTYHLGIGQGDLLVTPLQVAQFTQALAKKGTLCAPHLLQTKSPNCRELGVLEENVEIVLAGMLDACSAGGTAYPFFNWNSLHRNQEMKASEEIKMGAVACKTGTAEFGPEDEQGYRATHGWFTLTAGIPNIAGLPESDQAKNSQDFYDVSREAWLQNIAQKGFPKEIIITVLVESDEQVKYREGSSDAAPIAYELLKWIVYGEEEVPRVTVVENAEELGE